MRWTYRETDQEGAELEVVVTVTDQTKKIANGVTARVVRDTVTEDGEIIEDTFDWYAQDEEGNVWYLGRGHRRVRERQAHHPRKVPSRPASTAHCPASSCRPIPSPGCSYRQEYYKGEAEDNGEVLSTDEMVRGAHRPVRRRAPHQGHDHDRAGCTGVQAVRQRRRPRARPRRLGRPRQPRRTPQPRYRQRKRDH